MSTTTAPVSAPTIKLSDSESINVATVKIPTDRNAALALYASVKRAESAAQALLPKDKSETDGDGSAWVKAHEDYADQFTNPRKLLWDRISDKHQAGQGKVKRSGSYLLWLTRHGIA
jgi:hypothetical protein